MVGNLIHYTLLLFYSVIFYLHSNFSVLNFIQINENLTGKNSPVSLFSLPLTKNRVSFADIILKILDPYLHIQYKIFL